MAHEASTVLPPSGGLTERDAALIRSMAASTGLTHSQLLAKLPPCGECGSIRYGFEVGTGAPVCAECGAELEARRHG